MKTMPQEMISQAAQRLQALGDESRIRIMLALREAGEMSVSQLSEFLGMAQPTTSKHLSVLRQAGIVTVRREGALGFYAVHDASVFEICDLVCSGVRRRQEELNHALGITPSRTSRRSRTGS
ncbi:MAG: helix-turn-helix transcriptional regulator [Gemmatimonadetes bacterium]|nr:helix-turn-helix transcriptional regulator [Gemmatimonadota bacterium]